RLLERMSHACHTAMCAAFSREWRSFMFGFNASSSELQNARLQLAITQQTLGAIQKTMAMIEFTPQGEIINANEPFLATMGYGLDDVRDQHHRLFCTRELASSPAYAQFWKRLASG